MDNILAGLLECSSDGLAVVLRQAVDWIERTVLLDLESGGIQILPLPHRPKRIQWLPDQVPSRPERLRLVDLPSHLRWGERAEPRVILDYPNRPSQTASVTWSSSDPAVAAVSADGVLYANRPGSAYIAARYGSDLADTVQVTVSGSPTQRILLSEDFEHIDPRY